MSAIPNQLDYVQATSPQSKSTANSLKLVMFDSAVAGSPRNRTQGLPKPAAGFQRLEPTPELLEELAAASSRLESAAPEEIIAWGVEHCAPYLTMATAFGPEGCVILAML